MKKTVGGGSDGRERRRALRVKTQAQVPVEIQQAAPLTAQLLDVSESGALIGLSREVPIGNHLVVDLTGGETPLILEAKVERHGPAPMVAGVSWQDPTDEQKEALGLFLADINVLGRGSQEGDRKLRVHLRADIDVAKVGPVTKTHGLIQDLSTTGAGVLVPEKLVVARGSHITFSYEGTELRGTVQRATKTGKAQRLGVLFDAATKSHARRAIGSAIKSKK